MIAVMLVAGWFGVRRRVAHNAERDVSALRE